VSTVLEIEKQSEDREKSESKTRETGMSQMRREVKGDKLIGSQGGTGDRRPRNWKLKRPGAKEPMSQRDKETLETGSQGDKETKETRKLLYHSLRRRPSTMQATISDRSFQQRFNASRSQRCH